MDRRILFLIAFSIALNTVAAPPTPHVVRGIVRDSRGFEVPADTVVKVNDTVTLDYKSTATSGPTGATGRYAVSISGNNGDLVVVKSWNATMWGQSSRLLTGGATIIDVQLNLTRGSETNVTILSPANNSGYQASVSFQISARVSILGANANGCTATLSFSNPNKVNLSAGETYSHNLGSINRGSSVTTTWNVFAASVGTTDFTVMSSCATDTFILQYLYRDTASNLSVYDNGAPVVRATYPGNNSRINNPVVFRYNVTDNSPIINCSLYINSVVQGTTTNPPRGQILNFTKAVSSKYNRWNISCTENTPVKRVGNSGTYNLTINSIPSLTLSLPNPIDLIAGGQKKLSCNGTVTDSDAGGDIIRVNATLFNIDMGQTARSQDNKSVHYTNSSCRLSGLSGNTVKFNCTFSLEYYALNGTWLCNATARDSANATNSSIYSSELNQLIALGTQQNLIDYGSLGLSEESASDVIVNVTNYGNVKLDLDLFGFAIFQTDNLSMDCAMGNISVAYERFDTLSSSPYLLMNPLGGYSYPNSVNFNLRPKVEGKAAAKNVYWKMGIPAVGASGRCSGKVVFTALVG
jgi:hypothetical protein